MKALARKSSAVAALLVIGLFMLAPIAVHAAGTTYGPIVPDACNCPGTAASFGCVIIVVRTLITIAVTIGTIIATLAIVYAGFLWVTSAVNSENRGRARSMLINVVIGLVIVLAAYLIVDYIMSKLYNGSYGAWNSILADTANGNDCIAISTPTPIANPVGAIVQNDLTGTNANQTNPPAASSTANSTANAGNSHMNISAAIAKLQSDTTINLRTNQSKPATTSLGLCALYVRVALNAGGISGSFGDAPNGGPFLLNAGFIQVSSSDNPNGYTAQAGDVIVYPHEADGNGHIAMYTGSGWISDFVQQTIYPNSGNPGAAGPYVIYRP